MSKNNSKLKEHINDFYTINNFRNEFKSILENNNYINKENKKYNRIKYNNKYQIKNNYENNYYEENNQLINFEINNIKSENDELKFCLNSIIKILDKKFNKYLKISNINESKIKNIKKEIIKKN